MKKTWIVAALVALMALPAAATAKHHSTDVKNASKYCKAQRALLGTDEFKAQYKNKGKCVKQRVRELRAARNECRTEREADPAAFEQNYGTNENHRNAFGKCVSQHAAQTGDDNGNQNGEKHGANEGEGPQPQQP
jgi:hypothetical protein